MCGCRENDLVANRIQKYYFFVISMIMKPHLNFIVLDSVDSTNNYAMQKVHEGLACHGDAVFAYTQTSGKGQRGKAWESNPGENILLSVILKQVSFFDSIPFVFNAMIALTVRQFLEDLISETVVIKWPNDVYIRDRKSAGILIENNFRGSNWNWSIVGIGINVNQFSFGESVGPAISIKQLTGESYDSEALAKKLQVQIVQRFDQMQPADIDPIIETYNQHLYKKGALVQLKTADASIITKIIGVEKDGRLITFDKETHYFDFGSVEWVRNGDV
jgi:BirA family biotin operon repressor/biotin-[acetyl-CoA-carboxylase] ligase